MTARVKIMVRRVTVFTMMMVMTMIVSDEGGGIISISIVVIASAAMAANAIISVAAAMARGWTNRCDAATASLREKTARTALICACSNAVLSVRAANPSGGMCVGTGSMGALLRWLTVQLTHGCLCARVVAIRALLWSGWS